MIDITVLKQGAYPVAATKIKEAVKKTLEENGMVSDCTVEVALVGEAKMDELNRKYYKDETYVHPVFTFPESEGQFVFPPDGKIHLGEIVISYPAAVETAREKNLLIETVVCDLAAHGAMHLVGIHHD